MGRVFALSIDETIEWAIVDTDRLGEAPDKPWKLDISDGLKSPKAFSLQKALIERLASLKATADFPGEVEAIGISTIGVVDREKRTLARAIPRKPKWTGGTAGDRLGLVDFGHVVGRLFPGLLDREGEGSRLLVIENDASAKALAEWTRRRSRQPEFTGSLMYLNFDEGVNGGIIKEDGSFFSELHPEMGHMLPLPHPKDITMFAGVDGLPRDGCPRHHICYEGLASYARVRATWGGLDPNTLPIDHDMWDIISFYMAQLAMSSILMFRPNLVVIGGVLVDTKGTMIDLVRHYVGQLNENYIDPSEIDIQPAILSPTEIGLQGAIEIARKRAMANRVKRG